MNKLNNQSFKSTTSTKSKASTLSRFKLVDLLSSQKNKITSIDIHSNPTLSHLNATIRKICRSNVSPSTSSHNRIPPPPPPPGDSSRASTIDRRRKPLNTFEAFVCDANDYHNFHQHQHHHHHHNNHHLHRQYHAGNNHLMSLTVPELSNTIEPRINNATANDVHSVHASNCNLATAFRASNQSIVAGGGNNSICGGSVRGHAIECSNSAINLKYGSLRSYKGIAGCNGIIGASSSGTGCTGGRRTKRSNSEQLNSSYFHFQNIDGDFGGGEMDNNAFDSVLLPPQNCDNHKLPWKHRQCPSITSSSSGSSGRMLFSSKFISHHKFRRKQRSSTRFSLFCILFSFPLCIGESLGGCHRRLLI